MNAGRDRPQRRDIRIVNLVDRDDEKSSDRGYGRVEGFDGRAQRQVRSPVIRGRFERERPELVRQLIVELRDEPERRIDRSEEFLRDRPERWKKAGDGILHHVRQRHFRLDFEANRHGVRAGGVDQTGEQDRLADAA